MEFPFEETEWISEKGIPRFQNSTVPLPLLLLGTVRILSPFLGVSDPFLFFFFGGCGTPSDSVSRCRRILSDLPLDGGGQIGCL